MITRLATPNLMLWSRGYIWDFYLSDCVRNIDIILLCVLEATGGTSISTDLATP
jgi:hypothetical protein